MLVSFLMATSAVVSAQDQTQTKDRIHQEDHLMLQDGSCMLVSAGVATNLQKPMQLNNGTTVNLDGSYTLKNKQKLQLRDGECLDMNGDRYLTQNKFNKREMMTSKQIDQVRNNVAGNNKTPGDKGSGKKGKK